MAVDFTGPASIVLDAYNRSIDLANSSKSELGAFTDALNASIYSPPSLSVQWASLAPPTIPDVPAMPETPAIVFHEPGNVPTDVDGTMDALVVDDFTAVAPTLNFGPTPVLSFGSVPSVPSVQDVAIPSAPTVNLPDVPQYLTLSTPTFGGINLHEEWLDKLDTIPELTLIEPTPFDYTPGAPYSSGFLQNMQAILNERLTGGTGLDTAVEQGIWDRARDRETQIALAGEAEVMRSSEAFGFALPIGTLAAQIADSRRSYHDKLSGLSRDVAIKQADLEQANLQQTITMGIQLEGMLLDNAYKLEQLAFSVAKEVADNTIGIYNAGLEHLKALMVAYQTYAASYKTVIDAELAKVEVFKALLGAEQTKATINTTLVQQYKAQIDGAMSVVEIYKAQVGAAQTLVQLEQSKVAAGAEQIKAFVATVSAEVAKVEAYKAANSAEATKVEGYKALAEAYSAKTGAQAEKARVSISRFSALQQSNAAKWDGYKARVGAESARVQALASQSSVIVDGYKIAATSATAKAELTASIWRASLQQYESAKTVMINAAKINMDSTIATNNARLEAAKVGAQVYAQQVASAYNIVNTSASIGGTSSFSQTQQI